MWKVLLIIHAAASTFIDKCFLSFLSSCLSDSPQYSSICTYFGVVFLSSFVSQFVFPGKIHTPPLSQRLFEWAQESSSTDVFAELEKTGPLRWSRMGLYLLWSERISHIVGGQRYFTYNHTLNIKKGFWKLRKLEELKQMNIYSKARSVSWLSSKRPNHPTKTTKASKQTSKQVNDNNRSSEIYCNLKLSLQYRLSEFPEYCFLEWTLETFLHVKWHRDVTEFQEYFSC